MPPQHANSCRKTKTICVVSYARGGWEVSTQDGTEVCRFRYCRQGCMAHQWFLAAVVRRLMLANLTTYYPTHAISFGDLYTFFSCHEKETQKIMFSLRVQLSIKRTLQETIADLVKRIHLAGLIGTSSLSISYSILFVAAVAEPRSALPLANTGENRRRLLASQYEFIVIGLKDLFSRIVSPATSSRGCITSPDLFKSIQLSTVEVARKAQED